ncbi:DUF3426 domain-containing protein [Phenylobacterium sp.]|uniref:DUF3426 domain-containing protein n=1 Tax=Phenylobacterium sp. TaxID=1871053 RepID=UPI00391C4B37
MILTCPDCATSYFVDGARIPAEGRSVKCSACGARWRAFPEEAVSTSAPPPEPVAPPEPFEADVADDIVAEGPEVAAPPPPHPAAETAEAASAGQAEAAEEPAPRRRPPPPRKKAAGAAIAWAVAAAVVAAVAGALVFRDQVVRFWPAGAGLYAAVGLPADSLGLVIDQVKTQPTFQGGRPVLSITGAIRNTRDEAVTAPALRVSLLDKTGKPIAARIARPLNARIPPGATRYFAIAIPDPPAGLQTLDIAFEAADAPAAAPGAAAVEAVLGPEPIEAEPAAPGGHGTSAGHG